MTRRYPDGYFPGGERTDDSVDEIAQRVYEVGDRVPLTRGPFGAPGEPQIPFDSYVVQRRDTPHIRAWTFTAWLSLTKEILRGCYKTNLRRDPILREEATLYAAIRATLRATATPLTHRNGRPDLWALPGVRPLRPISDESLTTLLRERGASPADAVALALTLVGPCSAGRITRALWSARHPPHDEGPAPEPSVPPAQVAWQRRVRQAVVDTWLGLTVDDQRLLRLIVGGASYREAMEAMPEVFGNKMKVSRALDRLNASFLRRVIAAAGGTTSDADDPSDDLIEPLHEILVSIGILETP